MTPDLRARVRLFLLAALLGAGIGLFDRAQSAVQPAALLLFACAFGLAFVPALLGAGAGALVKIALRR